MRIAVVVERPPPHADRAGAARLRRFATEFADRDHDVTVYCAGWWDDRSRRISRDGVVYEAATVAPATPSFLARVPWLLARDRPDAVVASPSPPETVVAAAAGGAVARAPVVCDWFGDEPADDPRRWTAAARAATRVVAPSELHRTRIRELGVPDAETAVVPQGVDYPLVEATPPRERDRDGPEAVYARRLDADANLESLLLALAELRGRDDWTATVVGDGPERSGYEAQAAELGIADRVRFVGDVDRETRVATYRAADVFVQTATREQFPVELLWALAAGCVGIVEYQADSPAHELLDGHDRGVRVTESEALDEAIESAWTEPHRDLAEPLRDYDHAAVAGDYLGLFRDCGVDVR